MSLREQDTAGDTPSTATDPLVPTTVHGVFALDLIVTSPTNTRRTHNRAMLEEVLDNRSGSLAKVRSQLADYNDENRKKVVQAFGSEKFADFVHSIYVQGVNQPILLRPIPAARLADTQPSRPGDRRPEYEIVAGERRYFGSMLAGKNTIPAMVKPMTDQEAQEFQLVENLQRDDLHPMEEAEGYELLCRNTGIAKEEIGAKIGKSRSYVYGRLKLLELCQDARTAFYERGPHWASVALLLARIPDEKLQLKALKEFTEERFNGSTMSVRECQAWLQHNAMLRLDKAPFKITSETLLPDAGSCRTCPKRTGANPELFTDVDSADVCTDPKCYDKKMTAHETQLRADAEAKGLKVITGKQAQELRPHSWQNDISGFVDLDKPLPGMDKPLRKVLGKDAPAPTVFVDPHTHQARDVLPADVAGKLLKEKGVTTKVPKSSREEDAAAKAKRQAEEERSREKCAIEEGWRRRAMGEISASIRQGKPNSFSAPILRGVLKMTLENLEVELDEVALLDAWGLPAIAEDPKDPRSWKVQQERVDALQRHVEAAPDIELGCMFLQLLMSTETYVSPYALENGKAESTFITQLAIEASVDVAALEKEVKAERKAALKAAADAKAAKKGKNGSGATLSAAPAEGESEGNPVGADTPTGAKSKKARGKAAARASTEEVKSGIADAMQNIDSASATGFQVGQRVRFKQDLKGPGGKFRKVNGREGTIAQAIGDRAFSVKYGDKAHEVATADYTELEAVDGEQLQEGQDA